MSAGACAVFRPGVVRNSIGGLVAALMLAGCGGGGGDAGERPDDSRCGHWPGEVMLAEDMRDSVIASVSVIDACNMLLAGYDRAANPFDPSGDSRGFVLRWRLDAQGRVHEDWRYVLDGAGTDAITSVAWGADGIRFLGWSDGDGPGDEVHGQRDALIGRLAADGRPQALSRVGNARPNRPLALFELEEGRALLLGNDDVYVPTNYVEAWEDPWIAGLSGESGRYRMDWLLPVGSEEPDIWLAAERTSASPFSLALASNRFAGSRRGLSVEARDAYGQRLWLTQLTQAPYDNIAGLAMVPPAGLFAFGSSTQGLGGGISGGADLFIARMSAQDGRVEWLSTFGGPGTDWAAAFAYGGDRMYAVSEVLDDALTTTQAHLTRLSLDGRVLSTQTLIENRRCMIKSAALSGERLAVAGSIDTGDGRMRGWVGFVAR